MGVLFYAEDPRLLEAFERPYVACGGLSLALVVERCGNYAASAFKVENREVVNATRPHGGDVVLCLLAREERRDDKAELVFGSLMGLYVCLWHVGWRRSRGGRRCRGDGCESRGHVGTYEVGVGCPWRYAEQCHNGHSRSCHFARLGENGLANLRRTCGACGNGFEAIAVGQDVETRHGLEDDAILRDGERAE